MKAAELMGLVRHVLTFAGGYVVAQTPIDAASWEQAVGAIVTLVGVAWSVVNKKGAPK
jgi:hypothetical protein